jgi:hypothetical protein
MTDADRALIVGRFALAGYDVRVAKDGAIVVYAPRQKLPAIRRALYPEGRGAHITRPARGWFVVHVPETLTR